MNTPLRTLFKFIRLFKTWTFVWIRSRLRVMKYRNLLNATQSLPGVTNLCVPGHSIVICSLDLSWTAHSVLRPLPHDLLIKDIGFFFWQGPHDFYHQIQVACFKWKFLIPRKAKRDGSLVATNTPFCCLYERGWYTIMYNVIGLTTSSNCTCRNLFTVDVFKYTFLYMKSVQSIAKTYLILSHNNCKSVHSLQFEPRTSFLQPAHNQPIFGVYFYGFVQHFSQHTFLEHK